MNDANEFNLISEKWLPVEGRGRMSLAEIFGDLGTPNVSGSAVQKISSMKFLLALVQSAVPLPTFEDWKMLSDFSLAQAVSKYLRAHRDEFWLYGDRPFLQMPEAAAAEIRSFGVINPEIAGNYKTILTETQIPTSLSDAEKACLLISLPFALGGKKTDNTVVLTPGYSGKRKGRTCKPGPALGRNGYLHTFIFGRTLIETLRINLFTEEDIAELKVFPEGLGKAPWEDRLRGEGCDAARRLKGSFIGRLVPMNRFCLLEEKGLHYTDGVVHDSEKEGMTDPSVAYVREDIELKPLLVDQSCRPWRYMTALLRFLSSAKVQDGAVCPQLRLGLRNSAGLGMIRIWSGGLRVSTNSGVQFVSGSDNYLESWFVVPPGILNASWFQRFSNEIAAMDGLVKTLAGCMRGYLIDMKDKKHQKQKIEKAKFVFWKKTESIGAELIEQCSRNDSTEREAMRRRIYGIAAQIYDDYCPRGTPKQLIVWASHAPKSTAYFKAP